MVNQMEESAQISNVGSSESIGETAIILISIGSILVILCAASIIYGLRRRRYILASVGGTSSTEESVHNPTDFMNKLATWDRCHSIDEMLEKRRRSVWTLEIFENYGSGDDKTARQFHSDS